MNLKLQPLGPIAPGGTVFQVVSRPPLLSPPSKGGLGGVEAGAIMGGVEPSASTEETLWLASPAGLFQLRNPASSLLGALRASAGTEGGWRALRRGLPFWRLNAILAAGNSLWVAGMPGGLSRSPNSGKAWHQSWLDQVEAPLISLAASPNYSQDRVLLAGTAGEGILRSIDGGRYWDLSNFGLREFSVFNLAVAPTWDRYEYAFAATESHLYQSPNGGRAWRRAEIDREIQPLALAVSPTFATDQTVFAGSATGELLISTDAGRSYQLAATGFEAIEALAFTPQGTLLLGTPEGIYRFEATRLPSLFPPSKGRLGGVEPGSPIAALSPSSKEGLEGVHPLPSPVLGLNPIGPKIYAGLADGLALSSDDGQSWQMVPGLSARRFLWLLTPSPNLWLAAGPEEGVWRSTDGGQSWQQIWAETPVLTLTVEHSSSERGIGKGASQLWVSSPAGIATSTDSGLTWTTLPLFPPAAGPRPAKSPKGEPVEGGLGGVGEGERLITALATEGETLWAGSHDGHLWRRSPGSDWSTVKTPFTGSQMLGIFIQAAIPPAPFPPSEGPRPEVPPELVEGLVEGGLGGVSAVIVATWQAEKLDLWRSEDGGTRWSKWFSAASRAIAPQVVFTGREALVGLGSDLHRLLPDGRWQRQKLSSLEAPITALLPLADQLLVALTDRLVTSTPTGEWEAVETEVNGHPIAALAQAGEQLVILTGDGHIFHNE